MFCESGLVKSSYRSFFRETDFFLFFPERLLSKRSGKKRKKFIGLRTPKGKAKAGH
jgi:hypothetical protein